MLLSWSTFRSLTTTRNSKLVSSSASSISRSTIRKPSTSKELPITTSRVETGHSVRLSSTSHGITSLEGLTTGSTHTTKATLLSGSELKVAISSSSSKIISTGVSKASSDTVAAPPKTSLAEASTSNLKGATSFKPTSTASRVETGASHAEALSSSSSSIFVHSSLLKLETDTLSVSLHISTFKTSTTDRKAESSSNLVLTSVPPVGTGISDAKVASSASPSGVRSTNAPKIYTSSFVTSPHVSSLKTSTTELEARSLSGIASPSISRTDFNDATATATPHSPTVRTRLSSSRPDVNTAASPTVERSTAITDAASTQHLSIAISSKGEISASIPRHSSSRPDANTQVTFTQQQTTTVKTTIAIFSSSKFKTETHIPSIETKERTKDATSTRFLSSTLNFETKTLVPTLVETSKPKTSLLSTPHPDQSTTKETINTKPSFITSIPTATPKHLITSILSSSTSILKGPKTYTNTHTNSADFPQITTSSNHTTLNDTMHTSPNGTFISNSTMLLNETSIGNVSVMSANITSFASASLMTASVTSTSSLTPAQLCMLDPRCGGGVNAGIMQVDG
ncbi:hypothetical protein EG329_000986 [Mollisiaceae sp. DMI_Dod_QoI]|nr:hypothetical protein EG329_000986 [Helotiales sp. DMI_Dod_QoI]